MSSKSIREEINLAEILKKVPNRFMLTVAASKRARQLEEGATPLIPTKISETRPLDIALMEIQLGKIVVSVEDVSEEDSILDEISDYLDSDILDVDPNESQDTPKKRKQAV